MKESLDDSNGIQNHNNHVAYDHDSAVRCECLRSEIDMQTRSQSMHMYKDKLGEYGTTFLGPDRRISLLSSHMHICMQKKKKKKKKNSKNDQTRQICSSMAMVQCARALRPEHHAWALSTPLQHVGPILPRHNGDQFQATHAGQIFQAWLSTPMQTPALWLAIGRI